MMDTGCNHIVKAHVVEVHPAPGFYGLCAVLVRYNTHTGALHDDVRIQAPCERVQTPSPDTSILGCYNVMRPGKLHTDCVHMSSVKSFMSNIADAILFILFILVAGCVMAVFVLILTIKTLNCMVDMGTYGPQIPV